MGRRCFRSDIQRRARPADRNGPPIPRFRKLAPSAHRDFRRIDRGPSRARKRRLRDPKTLKKRHMLSPISPIRPARRRRQTAPAASGIGTGASDALPPGRLLSWSTKVTQCEQGLNLDSATAAASLRASRANDDGPDLQYREIPLPHLMYALHPRTVPYPACRRAAFPFCGQYSALAKPKNLACLVGTLLYARWPVVFHGSRSPPWHPAELSLNTLLETSGTISGLSCVGLDGGPGGSLLLGQAPSTLCDERKPYGSATRGDDYGGAG